MKVHVHVCTWAHISLLLGVHLEVQLLSHKLSVQLSEEPPDCVPKRLHHFTFPPTVYEGSSFPVFLLTRVIIWRVDYHHPRGYKVVFPCSFDWHFSGGCWFEHFSSPYWSTVCVLHMLAGHLEVNGVEVGGRTSNRVVEESDTGMLSYSTSFFFFFFYFLLAQWVS